MIMKNYGIQFGSFNTFDGGFIPMDTYHYFSSCSARRRWLIKHSYTFDPVARVWVYTTDSPRLRFEPAFITFKAS